MPMLPQAAYRGPTEAEYETIRKVYEATGILTAKDRVTSEWVKPQPRCGGVPWVSPYKDTPNYGDRYNPKQLEAERAKQALGWSGANANVGITGAGGWGADTYHVRSIETDLVSTPRLPGGVVVGGNEVWRRNVPLDIGGDDEGRTVKWYADISFEEMGRLRAWANEEEWVTDAVIAQTDKENRARREGRRRTQEDPVGALVDALVKAQPTEGALDLASLSDEALAQELANRRMAKARAARGQKVGAEA